jgi:hypothetical protein
MELPGLKGNEKSRVSQLDAIPFEYVLREEVGEVPASAGQVLPGERDSSLRRISGEVDDYHVPVTAVVTAPRPGDQVAAGLVVGPTAGLQ